MGQNCGYFQQLPFLKRYEWIIFNGISVLNLHLKLSNVYKNIQSTILQAWSFHFWVGVTHIIQKIAVYNQMLISWITKKILQPKQLLLSQIYFFFSFSFSNPARVLRHFLSCYQTVFKTLSHTVQSDNILFHFPKF